MARKMYTVIGAHSTPITCRGNKVRDDVTPRDFMQPAALCNQQNGISGIYRLASVPIDWHLIDDAPSSWRLEVSFVALRGTEFAPSRDGDNCVVHFKTSLHPQVFSDFPTVLHLARPILPPRLHSCT